MDFEKVWTKIRRVMAWYDIRNPSMRGDSQEILKPLNKIIDFEAQECIFENNFCF